MSLGTKPTPLLLQARNLSTSPQSQIKSSFSDHRFVLERAGSRRRVVPTKEISKDDSPPLWGLVRLHGFILRIEIMRYEDVIPPYRS
jgi:hypothetical protein